MCMGDIYKRLRKKGKPVPSNDMWIAASAMQNGLALLTQDNHFELIEDEETNNKLKQIAEQKGLSVNSLVVGIIRQALGFEERRKQIYTDLDHLAGRWSEKEYREFERNTKSFEAIDEKLW